MFSSNRVKVVPFERHFTEKEQNKHLKEQLQQEIDGILNWCIQGLSLYRKEGLEPPTAVQIATHEYSEDSDKVGKFISECLEKSDQNLAAKDVYEKYSQCAMCGRPEAKCRNGLQVHHITYQRLGHEDIYNDLVSLCPGCHKKIHSYYRRKRHGYEH